jgi:cell division FtsZ-interacting protein ZapD
MEGDRDELLAHLELQARTLAAMAALAQLDDTKTDELLAEIRNQLAVMSETLRRLGVTG